MSATTSIPNTNNNVTTSSPDDQSVVTAELLLAILVPVILTICVCSIACFRYFKNKDEIESEEKHQMLRREFIPADEPIGLDASLNQMKNDNDGITRLGKTLDTSSTSNNNHNTTSTNGKINMNRSNNNKNQIQDPNYYSSSNDYEEGGEDEYYDEEDYYEEEEETNNSNYQNNNTGSSSGAKNNQQKRSTNSSPLLTSSHRFANIKRYDPEASTSADETTDYDSETSYSRLPPAPGEAAIINPFGRANVHTKISKSTGVNGTANSNNKNNNSNGAAAAAAASGSPKNGASNNNTGVKNFRKLSVTDL